MSGMRPVGATAPAGVVHLRATAAPSGAGVALVRRLAAAAAATMLVNGFAFALGLLLVRTLAPRAFGVWAMLSTLQSIAGVFLTALVAQPMAWALPRACHPARARAEERVFASVAGWCIAAFVPVTVATLCWLGLPVSIVAGGGALVAATGVRNHARLRGYALRQPRAVLAQDAVFVALATAGIAGLAVAGWRRDLAALLVVLTLANVIAVVWRSGAPPLTRARVRRHVVAYRRHAGRAAWSLVTVSLSTLSALAPNLALASTGSLAALR